MTTITQITSISALFVELKKSNAGAGLVAQLSALAMPVPYKRYYCLSGFLTNKSSKLKQFQGIPLPGELAYFRSRTFLSFEVRLCVGVTRIIFSGLNSTLCKQRRGTNLVVMKNAFGSGQNT